MTTPFKVTIYDRDFNRLGRLGSYEALSVTAVHNGPGTANITLAATHRRVPTFMEKGARVVIEYDDQVAITGALWNKTGTGPLGTGSFSFTVRDDWNKLYDILGWPAPTRGIYEQGEDDDGEYPGDYDKFTGPAETVVKHYVTVNAQRLGLPLTCAPDQGRGQTVTASLRFHPLPDRLFPLVEQAGIGVTVRQAGAGWVLDCYEPVVRPRLLTAESGVVTQWSWSQSGPTNSRVIIGGQGEGVDRDWELQTALDREAEWGPSGIIEVMRDARDVEQGNYALLQKRGQESLAEGAPSNGLNLTLAETKTFRYGRTFRVGDQVRARIAEGVIIEDILRSVQLNHTSDAGVVVTPVLGDPQQTAGPDTIIASAIAKLARAIRDLKAR